MEGFSTEVFIGTLALVGAVILVAALLSGLIERTGLPQVAVLLGLGAALGPSGLNLLQVTLDSPILRIVATLSLVLVLFTDAVSLDLREVRRHAGLAALMLGPGTLLSSALIALAAWAMLGLPIAAAVILGAALASTDPILLRGMLRTSRMPSAARLALRLESGMNDVALLPIVVVAMSFLGHDASMNAGEFAKIAIDLLVLGPGAGVLVGLISVAVLDMVRRRIGVRRDYESLYAIGVAFTAFAAAEAVHGSGFLAAFAAGLTISAFDVELCDCFLEYGETTAEMTLLFTFVILGSSLIWSGLGAIGLMSLLFVAIVLLSRLPIMLVALARTGLDVRGRLLIGWFGPRGLGSLLLVLLPIFAGIPGGEGLFAICCLVVLFSVVLHGGTPLFLARRAQPVVPPPPPSAPTQAAELEPAHASVPMIMLEPLPPPPLVPETGNGVATDDLHAEEPDRIAARYASDRITLDEMRKLQERGEPVIITDVRTERSLGHTELQARGSVRLPPDDAVAHATALGLPRDAWLLAYCT